MSILFQHIRNASGKCWYWRMAVIRCLIYGSIVAWGVFKAGVEGFDSLSDLSHLQLLKLKGDMCVAFGGVLLAFLDNTLSKLGPDTTNQNQTTP